MCQFDDQVALGFTAETYPRGVHVCHLYRDDAERDDVMRRFLAAGLEAGELATCFSDYVPLEAIAESLRELGVDVDTALASGRLSVNKAQPFYFGKNRFDPNVMLDGLCAFHASAESGGFAGARVIGEMSPLIQDYPGGERLAEYESRVNLLSASHPVTAICQYDTRRFRGDVILEVLSVHPLMVRDGCIIENPFYVTPAEYLESHGPS